jgi:hypothetical protein
VAKRPKRSELPDDDLVTRDEDRPVSVLDRAARIEEALAAAEVDGDGAWYVKHLNGRQIQFCLLMAKYGDARRAFRESKLSGSLDATVTDPYVAAYIRALDNQASTAAFVDRMALMERFNRIALRAEDRGDFKNALAANTSLAKLIGLDRDLGVNRDADGRPISIAASRGEDVIDADYEEVLKQNGIDVKSLEQDVTRDKRDMDGEDEQTN